MMIGEFEVINKFFATQSIQQDNVALGIGDDAAIVSIPEKQQLVITTDTLVSNIHFPAATSAYDIGFKSIAVNLSDLAAMGATPSWVTLSLTLPKINETWLEEFSQGFFALASRYRVQLIGGDLSQGPLSITVGAFGFVPLHQALTRNGAKPGDLIYVTNTLGEAALGLQHLLNKIHLNDADVEKVLTKLNRPEPQIEIGSKLRNIASAAIDISDGLAADLSHILEQSDHGAKINVDEIPIGTSLLQNLAREDALTLALTGGDDYELCFTVTPEKRPSLEKALPKNKFQYTCIGTITSEKGLDLRYQDGNKYAGKFHGYQHFQK